MHRRFITAVGLAVCLGTAGTVLGAVALLRGPQANAGSNPGGTQLRSGVYADDPSGTPHYLISVTTSGGLIDGAVDFLYQDGQTDVAFTFAGSAHYGVATLSPRYRGARSARAAGPSALSATFDSRSLVLGECPTYLSFATSLSSCQFIYRGSGRL